MKMESGVEILLVEDNPRDAELTLRSLKKRNLANHLLWVKDGAEALECLFGVSPAPSPSISHAPKVILLDLKLPKVGGLEVLRRLKGDERTKHIPVVALTGHAYTPTPLLMNLKLFNSMTKAQQEAVLKAAKEGALAGRAHIAKSLGEEMAMLRGYGVQFNEVDKRPFQQKMGDVYKQFEPQLGKDLIESILRSE